VPGPETARGCAGRAPIDDLLRDARVLSEEYNDYRPPSIEQRITRARERRAQVEADGASRGARVVAATPNRAAEHEQARHELDLTATLVLNTDKAAAYLHALGNLPPDEQGALVFGCLLYLTGRENAAQYWWRFAAGAGNPTAAFCLYLDHRRYAEYRDADFWRLQARRLRASPMPRSSATGSAPGAPARACKDADSLSVTRPSAPAYAPAPVSERAVSELRDLLAQCHSGRHPHLPLLVEAAINQLPVLPFDAPHGFGEIPTSSPHLAATFGTCGSAVPPGSRPGDRLRPR
jgi:hypothetical protein